MRGGMSVGGNQQSLSQPLMCINVLHPVTFECTKVSTLCSFFFYEYTV